MKKIYFKNKPIVCLTAYNKFFAEMIDDYCDLVLVGDSLGMAYYGDKSTREVSIQDIIRHAKSVKKGIKKSILVVDMPFGSYKNKESAKKNALKILKETKCDAIKLEGGEEVSEIINYLVKNSINVMAHIGLMPQKIKKKKDYRSLGKNYREENKIIRDLISVQKSGAFSVVLEAVKEKVAIKVMEKSKIPVIGIGASKECDGQILVLEDMLGFFEKTPKFVKKYLNIKNDIKKAVKKYSNDVRFKKFPTKKNIYI